MAGPLSSTHKVNTVLRHGAVAPSTNHESNKIVVGFADPVLPQKSKHKGWKLVYIKLPEIRDYGRAQGILERTSEQMVPISVGGEQLNNIKAVHEESTPLNDMISEDVDITYIHQAIPFLPLPVAFACLFLNSTIPGLGTILSGWLCLCKVGKPRVRSHSSQTVETIITNTVVGISQFLTITMFLVGYFWSVAWGCVLVIYSKKYAEYADITKKQNARLAAVNALSSSEFIIKTSAKGNNA